MQKNKIDILRFHSFISYFFQEFEIPENFLLTEILDIETHLLYVSLQKATSVENNLFLGN